MSLTMYNFLENILATLAVIVPFYFMMPYQIERKKVVFLGLLLLASNLCLYPKIGSWVNLIGIPLVLALMVWSSKADRVVNFYMMSIGYMMTVLCNYVVIIIFRLCGIDLYTVSLVGSIVFQVIYCTLAFAAAYFIGKKIRSYGKKLKSYSKLYQKIEKIACAYIGVSFVGYEIGILALAKSGNSMDVMIQGAVVMSILFFSALAFPAYVISATKKEIEKEAHKKSAEKDNEMRYIIENFFDLAGIECKKIKKEDFLRVKIDILDSCKRINGGDHTANELIKRTMEELQQKIYGDYTK